MLSFGGGVLGSAFLSGSIEAAESEDARARYLRSLMPSRDDVDLLDSLKVPYVDLMAAHAADRKQFKASTVDYLRRFFVGHYNPLGNHFCAFAMVEPLARMLDPRPASHGPATSVRGGFIK